MHQGLYITAKGMLAQERRHDVVAQNLANVSTAGYQRQMLAFHAQVVEQVQSSATTTPTKRSPFAHPSFPTGVALATDHVNRAEIQETGNPTHLALVGEGYFTVETPQGLAYTRNGAFTLASDGRLITQDGLPVCGEQGPITITSPQWEVSPDGRVLVQEKVVDRLRVVTMPNPSDATRLGTNLWQTATAQPLTRYTVQQKALEGSNVSAVTEMMILIRTTRQFEACQKCMQAVDSVLDRAVNDVGRT
jgi:flagellar basal-body rod protein FlgF